MEPWAHDRCGTRRGADCRDRHRDRAEFRYRRKADPAQARAPLRRRRRPVPSRSRHPAGAADHRRQSDHEPGKRYRDLPDDAPCRKNRASQRQFRDVHLLVGRRRPGVRRGAVGTRPRRRPGARTHRLARQPEDGTRAAGQDDRGGCARGALSPAALVSTGSHEQSHAPQVVDRRRRGGLHRRRRHRRQLERGCNVARSLARLALSPPGAGSRPDAGRVHGQLDQDHRHGAAGQGVLPGAASRG